jgi:hypothetical protein
VRRAVCALLALAITACQPAPAPTPPASQAAAASPISAPDASALEQLAAGQAGPVQVAGVTLDELPAAFDLNPMLAKDAAFRASHGIGLIATGSVEVSRLRLPAGAAHLSVTPFVRSAVGTGLRVNYSLPRPAASDTPAPDPAVAAGQRLLISKRGSHNVTAFVLSRDGSIHDTKSIGPDWVVIVALVVDRGVVCWNVGQPGADSVLGPYACGYRRFVIQAPENVSDAEGWRFLLPRIGQ